MTFNELQKNKIAINTINTIFKEGNLKNKKNRKN
jgi:hypothetical protein